MMLINASNLHVGGGVQVATSVIGELTFLDSLPNDLEVWVSSEVDSNLKLIGYDLSRFSSYEVVDAYGIKILTSNVARRLQKFKAVLTVFGPLYVLQLQGANITGFGQAWIIYPKNEAYNYLAFIARWIARIKYSAQAFFFRRSNLLIVELNHVRKRLIDLKIASNDRIKVIPNSLSSIYAEPNKWHPIEIPYCPCDIALGFVGRNYSHKNTSIFPKIHKLLKSKYNINACFYVTFTDLEFSECDEDFKSFVINVGPLSVTQCPNFYKKMDAVIFPSLLECFSATPLEAMATSRPLFASDRSFNRDICGDYAYYFDPLSPEHAAQVIANYYPKMNTHDNLKRIEDARKHAFSFSSPALRAKSYLDLLIAAANQN